MSTVGDTLKSLTYEVSDEAPAPEVDQFLVTLSSKGLVSSVYHIAEVRQVKSPLRRFALKVLLAEDMKPHVIIDGEKITVKGMPALPLAWYSRKKRQHPREFTEQELLGAFQGRAATLLVLYEQQVYAFAQWADLDELQHALGFVRHGEPIDFKRGWNHEPALAVPPLAPAPIARDASSVDEFSGNKHLTLVDDKVLSDAVILYYHDADWQGRCWSSHRNARGKMWRDMVWESWPELHALWAGTPVLDHGLNPATLPEVLGRIRLSQWAVVNQTDLPEDQKTQLNFRYDENEL